MASTRESPDPQHPSDPGQAEASSIPRITTRRILSLALPALGALIAEPLFTVIDSTMVGHLGTPELAGLGIASTVLNTAVGLFVFLAYSTTSLAGRHLGAGRRDRAIRSGVEAMWLAGALGVLAALLLAVCASPLLSWLGADAETMPHALAYLRSSAPGLVGMFVVLAATGTLRGLQDTRTPWWRRPWAPRSTPPRTGRSCTPSAWGWPDRAWGPPSRRASWRSSWPG